MAKKSTKKKAKKLLHNLESIRPGCAYSTPHLAAIFDWSIERVHTTYIYTGIWEATFIGRGRFAVMGDVIVQYVKENARSWNK